METVTIGQRVRLHSEVLGEDREIIVKLPDTYGTTEQRYPIIFMLDANYTIFFANDVLSVGFIRWLNRIPELIVVGVLNTDRDRDMIPIYLEERKTGGGSDRFLRFITDELRPFLDANYRATGYHVLYGASNAGLFTVYALLSRPGFFAAGIASSPMIGHCPEYMHRLARDAFRAHPDMRNKLFLVYGRDDYPGVVGHAPGFAELLREEAPEGLMWEMRVLEDEGHVPFTSLYDGLRFVFPQRG